jgi:uncharacterized membrane protein YidH (DUF202 family)
MTRRYYHPHHNLAQFIVAVMVIVAVIILIAVTVGLPT